MPSFIERIRSFFKKKATTELQPEISPLPEVQIEEIPKYRFCKICNPAMYEAGELQTQIKTFQCNFDSCKEWFCAEHFVKHTHGNGERIRGYIYTPTGEGGMAAKQFDGTIGYVPKNEIQKR